MLKDDRDTLAGEMIFVTGTVIVLGACLFEWIVVSPDHPGQALLRVLCAGIAATLLTRPSRGA